MGKVLGRVVAVEPVGVVELDSGRAAHVGLDCRRRRRRLRFPELWLNGSETVWRGHCRRRLWWLRWAQVPWRRGDLGLAVCRRVVERVVMRHGGNGEIKRAGGQAQRVRKDRHGGL